jgi:signal transduction histidine kinase
MTLAPGQQRLAVRYSSLNLGAPERLRFQYRLAGHEGEWVEAGNTRLATYSKLPPGEYLFEVRAASEDGVWSETPRTLALVVLPPFWRTWWFVTTAVVVWVGMVAGTVYWIATRRLARQVAALREKDAVERERARIARDIHDQLGASLTQVALLGELVESDKDAPDEVEAHARQISLTARETTRTLDEIVWTVNPSNDTVEGMVNYVCKYAQEYLAVAGIKIRLDVPEPVPARELAPEVRHNVFLVAKEAATNIVRHAEATSAWFRLSWEAAGFVLAISDDGGGLAAGFEERLSVRNGLRNMRKRMEDVGGSFAMERAPEGGLLLRLSVPYRKP